jgi:L-ribulose-5-phosphate 3-epimerase UlaE
MQSSIRTGMFPLAIKAEILNIIQNVLLLRNPYVKIYKQAGELWRENLSIEMNIVIKSIISQKIKHTTSQCRTK